MWPKHFLQRRFDPSPAPGVFGFALFLQDVRLLSRFRDGLGAMRFMQSPGAIVNVHFVHFPRSSWLALPGPGSVQPMGAPVVPSSRRVWILSGTGNIAVTGAGSMNLTGGVAVELLTYAGKFVLNGLEGGVTGQTYGVLTYKLRRTRPLEREQVRRNPGRPRGSISALIKRIWDGIQAG